MHVYSEINGSCNLEICNIYRIDGRCKPDSKVLHTRMDGDVRACLSMLQCSTSTAAGTGPTPSQVLIYPTGLLPVGFASRTRTRTNRANNPRGDPYDVPAKYLPARCTFFSVRFPSMKPPPVNGSHCWKPPSSSALPGPARQIIWVPVLVQYGNDYDF